jgi:hypothetical protein
MGKTAMVDHLVERFGGTSAQGVVVRARFGGREQLPGSSSGLLSGLIVQVAEGMRALVPDGDGVPWLLPGADFVHAVEQVAELPVPGGLGTLRIERVHAELLLGVAQSHPVLLALDDVHLAGPTDRAILEAVAQGLEAGGSHLLVVAVGALPLGGTCPLWSPVAEQTPLPPAVSPEALLDQARHALPARGADDLAQVVDAASNPRVLDRLLAVVSRSPEATLAACEAQPEYQSLVAIAAGLRPEMSARAQADLRDMAVIGDPITTSLAAQLWGVPAEAAQERLEALQQTGFIALQGRRWRFLSPSLVAAELEALPPQHRARLHLRLGEVVLGELEPEVRDQRRAVPDVTETWSESRRRARRNRDRRGLHWLAAWHFAHGGAHDRAAATAVGLAEQLLDELEGRAGLVQPGQGSEGAQRQEIDRALAEAAAQLKLAIAAGPALSRLGIDVRVSTALARLRALAGDFSLARRAIESAVDAARHLPSTQPEVRLEALRVQVQVGYAAGDHNAGRAGLAVLFEAIAGAPRPLAVRTFAWLAEFVGRFEWVGLHDRIYPYVLEQLGALGAHREAIKARIDRLAAAMESQDTHVAEALLAEAVEEARLRRERPYLAELLAVYAAELIHAQVNAHYDSLSGEFFPPDLFGEGAPLPSIGDRLANPVDLLTRAEIFAEESGESVSHLRVLTTVLSVIYTTRERCLELLVRWLPGVEGHPPRRLVELDDLLSRGFFDGEQIEGLTERVLVLGQALGLDQVVGDTLYDALDQDLPSLRPNLDEHFALARAAYGRVGDVYGLATLGLVEVRARTRLEQPTDAAMAQLEVVLAERGSKMSAEQQAFVHSRLGEWLLGDGATERAVTHLEQGMRNYDRVGDVPHMHAVGDILREVYRKQGDLGRYRMLRDRFKGLEDRTPGVDPLGLELRIEHLLNLARQEQDDEKAIEMVERCVHLFARVPDGTARIDECFVEISKICRRRADGAQTEQGLHDWLRRSLDAVRAAGAINHDLGNYHRLFEESHELFDDLIGMGAMDDYVLARAESRALAFGVGNVAELIYLFDEHLQFDPEAGFNPAALPELRGFFEALVRYLLGLGAGEQALSLQRTFVQFLASVGETELERYYRAQRLTT